MFEKKPPILYTKNLVRFAQNWNDGTVEYWNIGSFLQRFEKYHDS